MSFFVLFAVVSPILFCSRLQTCLKVSLIKLLNVARSRIGFPARYCASPTPHLLSLAEGIPTPNCHLLFIYAAPHPFSALQPLSAYLMHTCHHLLIMPALFFPSGLSKSMNMFDIIQFAASESSPPRDELVNFTGAGRSKFEF